MVFLFWRGKLLVAFFICSCWHWVNPRTSREVAYSGKVEMAQASGTASPSHHLTQALQLGLSGRLMATLYKHQLNATFSEALELSWSPVYLWDTQREALLSQFLFVGFSISILLVFFFSFWCSSPNMELIWSKLQELVLYYQAVGMSKPI